jgi:hypothetical protein
MDENKEGGSESDRQRELDEEVARALQAAEDSGATEGSNRSAFGEEEGEGEEEETEGVEFSEEELAMYNLIAKENIRQYAAEATVHKLSRDYEKACSILKLILAKGEVIYGSAVHPDLASYYYMMGTFTFMKQVTF